MGIITVFSAKGGVGKTTMAVDFAWRAAQAGHRTLLWDLDPQGGAGFLLGFDEPLRKRAASVFQRDGRPRELIEPTAYERLSLLRADESLRGLPLQLARLGQGRRLAQLAGFLSGDFDRIIFDCPAGMGDVAEQALAAADLVIVPLPPSPLSARSLDTLRCDLLRAHRRHAPILPVVSMYDSRRKLHREVVANGAANWPVVPMASQLEQSAVRRAPIGEFAPHSDASRALNRLWNGIEHRLAGPADRKLHTAFSPAQAMAI